ncbi:malyl-CoA thiolesterase [Deinococcus sp. RL]|uniref:HpcH/HpaI aldolase/citrate lyase family protein n=1 Tax=Deinococcus sp. RL TaxID=1489678 RepID=UPI0004D671D6|nr:CoA ester lyase [Deinococcus sp. RL]KEF33829.1 malyl-CoA thiolesterase [Deinococcus sp. RL]
MSLRPWRSVLYVPGDKPRALEKARTLGADAVILDLEDAVAPEHKDAARQNVAEALRTPWPGPVLVRVNGPGTPWAEADLAWVRGAGASGLVLPKVEDAAALRDLPPGLPPLWAMVETPLGVLRAAELAALPSVAGLIAGTNDLARALRTRPDPARTPLLPALSAVVLAARAFGKVPLDGVYNDVRDPEGLERECEQGRTLGFSGKTVIHPGQVAAANRAFGVSEADAQAARDLLSAWTAARAAGRSVATYRGALVEEMHAEEAQETLALWEAAQQERPLA